MQHDADEESRIKAAASLMKTVEHWGVRRALLQQGRDFEGEVLDVGLGHLGNAGKRE